MAKSDNYLSKKIEQSFVRRRGAADTGAIDEQMVATCTGTVKSLLDKATRYVNRKLPGDKKAQKYMKVKTSKNYLDLLIPVHQTYGLPTKIVGTGGFGAVFEGRIVYNADSCRDLYAREEAHEFLKTGDLEKRLNEVRDKAETARAMIQEMDGSPRAEIKKTLIDSGISAGVIREVLPKDYSPEEKERKRKIERGVREGDYRWMAWNEEYDRTMSKVKKMGDKEIVARMETRLEKAAPKGKCIIKLAWLRPEHKRYFDREQKVAGLKHKNLAYMLAVDEAQQPKPKTDDDHEKSKIIVTAQEYIDNEMTPWERVQTGLDQRIDFAIQTGEGLRELHRLGLLHRDIKRSNLLITKDGLVKVIDTGLMKALDYTESSVTQDDEIVGTPAYYPPEQAGEDTVDIRADIYALGSTLYEYLIGVAPNVMATQNPQTINAILKSRKKKVFPLMPSQTNALNELIAKFVEEKGLSPEQAKELPGFFDAVFTKLLHRDKNGRYRNVPQYLADLNALKAGERPPVAFEELGRRKLTPKQFATEAFSYHMGDYLEDETVYADAKKSQKMQRVLDEGGFIKRHWKKFAVGAALLGAVATPIAIVYQDAINQVIDFITGK